MAQSEIMFTVQEGLEGGYEARALGHSIFTQADSIEELKTRSATQSHAILRMVKNRMSFACIRLLRHCPDRPKEKASGPKRRTGTTRAQPDTRVKPNSAAQVRNRSGTFGRTGMR